MLNLLKQEILDWRHKTVPAGVTEHRAVLGTKAHTPRIPEAKPVTTDDDGVVLPAPPPELPARPALHGDLPSPAVSILKAAEENGWTADAWIMRGTLMDVRWKPNRVITSVVIRAHRDRHRVVAVWVTKPWRGVPFHEFVEWEFDGAWSLGHHVEPLGGNELRAVLKYPRTRCDTCGEPVSLHVSTEAGPVCFNEWVAIQAAPEPRR
jgi:hypothetical protein